MWSEGTIGIPDANIKDKYTVCHYWVKHYDEPSENYGINGGKISKKRHRCIGLYGRRLRRNEPRSLFLQAR